MPYYKRKTSFLRRALSGLFRPRKSEREELGTPPTPIESTPSSNLEAKKESYATDEGLPKPPSEMMDDIRRRQQTGVSTRKPRGGDQIFVKTVRETVHGIGSFVREKVTKGWKGGQSFYDTEHGSALLACGCVVKSRDEYGGMCHTCNKPACPNHLHQCLECHIQICSVHMKAIGEYEFCLKCYKKAEFEVGEGYDTWDEYEPPPKSFLD